MDQSAEVLDRLVGLHQFIPAELIRQAIDQTGRRNRSDCRLTHAITLITSLLDAEPYPNTAQSGIG